MTEIKTEAEYNKKLKRYETLLGFQDNISSEELEEFDKIEKQLNEYEDRFYPIPEPTKIGELEFIADQFVTKSTVSKLEYDGFIGEYSYQHEERMNYGKIVNIEGLITFQGRNEKDTKIAFVESVLDYKEIAETLKNLQNDSKKQ